MLIQHNGYTFTKRTAHHQEQPLGVTSAYGCQVGAATDAKGSWSATRALVIDFDSQWVQILINAANSSAAERNLLIDIGTDETGGTSYNVIIPDLIGGMASSYRFGGICYEFPLYIPAGSRISARGQMTGGTSFSAVLFRVLGGSTDPRFHRLGSRVEAVGVVATAGNAQGTPVTPGTTSEGAWTSLGTTAKRCFHWNVAGHQKTNAAPDLNIHMDLAFGADPKTVICENALYNSTSEEIALVRQGHNGFCEVPAGETIYGRAQAGSATVVSFSMAAWGTY